MPAAAVGAQACRSCGPGADDAIAGPRAFPSGLLLSIPALDCTSEELDIRRALEGLPEIRGLRFDLAARTLAVDALPAAWPGVLAAVRGAGYEATPAAALPPPGRTAQAQRAELRRLAAALLAATAAESIHFLAPGQTAWTLAGMAVAAAAIALSGLSVLRKGLAALRRAQLNISALMSVAVIGAFLIGQWPEAAMVMALYTLAEAIEGRSVERARRAIAGLLALAPPRAEVQRRDGSWSTVEAALVAVGARARVRPGERFALDGRVTSGHSAVDQSPVTGESTPVDKGPGDEVFAGSVNRSGSLEFDVTRPASDTLLARIIHAVEQAQATRAPTQRFVDRFAAVYTPAVFALALALALLAPFLLGWAWTSALYKALVLLVIACPCALVISTPVTLASALAAAARRGILIKGGVYLEQARRLAVVAFDKTGTLTEGRPRLVASVVLPGAPPAAEVLGAARALAARSDHPVSKAIAAGLQEAPPAVDAFGAEPGLGVHGTVAGRAFVLGNHRWIEQRRQCSPALEALLHEHEVQGRTAAILADASGPLALFAVADTIRPTSRQALAELRALGVASVMLTGDNPATARAIADELGLADVRSNLLPQEKLDAVAGLAAAGKPVAMVGDGINDAPALASASIGFSLGGAGTDAATEAADVLIMNDDLRRVPETIRLSRRARAVLWQNIALALGIKAVFLALAVFDDASMWMAVFADMGASLLVVFNGLRLLGAEASPGDETGPAA
ncbi:MAG: heavy metal translocating P-type ATPase [Rubrivivax sp.]